MSEEPSENTRVTITCKECGHEVEKPLRWLRSNTSLKCESCESEVTFSVDKDSIATADALNEMMKKARDISD